MVGNNIKQPISILFSTRDPGAAIHLLPLITACVQDTKFSVSVVASEPALSILKFRNTTAIPFYINNQNHINYTDDPELLLASAKEIVDKISPDIVLTSISSLGIGIDEALLAVSPVPTLAIQDFWGDVNLGLGIPADMYLVNDTYAADITEKRWGVKALPIGIPKYIEYSFMDIDKQRSETRKELGVSQDKLIIGFFGQSPDIPGYINSFNELAVSISEMHPCPLLLIREHPKFSNEHNHIALLDELNIEYKDVTGICDVEKWLCACDIITTCYSASAIDHAYLSHYAKEPIGLTLLLLYDDDMRTFVTKTCGFIEFPTISQGIGKIAKSKNDIKEYASETFRRSELLDYYMATQKLTNYNAIPDIITLIQDMYKNQSANKKPYMRF